jgi:hypothetical protein
MELGVNSEGGDSCRSVSCGSAGPCQNLKFLTY